jgi:hypothetical protein
LANLAFTSGHILCTDLNQRSQILKVIDTLPGSVMADVPFAIWKGIFHAPLDPCRAGYIITFGLSHKYFGEPDEIGSFLHFWEDLISKIIAEQIFMAIEQEFVCSDQPFGKFYFQWENHPNQENGWIFCGTMPNDDSWVSQFETRITK